MEANKILFERYFFRLEPESDTYRSEIRSALRNTFCLRNKNIQLLLVYVCYDMFSRNYRNVFFKKGRFYCYYFM